MKVLADDAILDPTQVEAKVRRQVENRRLGHERMNEKRKLTPDARREKVEKGKEKEEAKGLFGAVFRCAPFSLRRRTLLRLWANLASLHQRRVRYLSNPQHKFKVRRNAEQNNLTGCCIFNPKFCLVYVEGSAKAVKFYKRVMLVRIDWTESARPLPGEEDAPPPVKEEGAPEENMDENRCDLIWEGPLKDKSFNVFRPKNTESERSVREFLGESNQGYWDVSRLSLLVPRARSLTGRALVRNLLRSPPASTPRTTERPECPCRLLLLPPGRPCHPGKRIQQVGRAGAACGRFS